MALIKLISVTAITMALFTFIGMTSFNINKEGIKSSISSSPFKVEEKFDDELVLPSKRMNRFLAEDNKNPRAADHCNKDYQVCSYIGGYNTTCCNNKCVDLAYDNKNCGVCKNKCKYTQTCCRGECVNVAYDKRHCGKCNNRCRTGEYCVYSMCNYA